MKKLCNIAILVFLTNYAIGCSIENTGDISEESKYNETAHKWIVQKAVEYLAQKDSKLNSYPIKEYIAWIKEGVAWADESEVFCKWYIKENDPFYEGSCDTIHHYGSAGDIMFVGEALVPEVPVANTGGFAAPFYSNVLFDMAKKFWPGGEKPDLNDLPKKEAGYISAFLSHANLGKTWVGGFPFCELYVLEKYGSDLVPNDILYESCPKWPSWATNDDEDAPLKTRYKVAQESRKNAMKYLGWAIHMIEDMTVPVHALNTTGNLHASYEKKVDEWVQDKSFDHLPIAETDKYHNSPCGFCGNGDFWFPTSPEYVKRDWSPEQFANEGKRIAADAGNGTSIQPSFDEFRKNYVLWHKSVAEQGVDNAIKLVAALLDKYFTEISLKPDQFESNDSRQSATNIAAGSITGANLDSTRDEDWYKIVVPDDHSDLVFSIPYDKEIADISMEMERKGVPGIHAPTVVPGGKMFKETSTPAGEYYVHVYLMPDQVPVEYSISVQVSPGSLPRDDYESNDTPETAKEFYSGCDLTGTLTIHNPQDIDYYYIPTRKGSRITTTIAFTESRGKLSISQDGNATTSEGVEPDGSRSITISSCGAPERSIVKAWGNRNYYTMCVTETLDTACGAVATPPKYTGFYFDTTIALDNVFILTFERVQGSGNTFLPVDTDSDLGGNIAAGKSGQSIPAIWGEQGKNYFILVGTTEDESEFVISASQIDLRGKSFDSICKEFGLFGGSQGLLSMQKSGKMGMDIAMKFDDAGTPDGILLTPLGQSATLYKASDGTPIGTIRGNLFANPAIPGGIYGH